MHLPAKPSNAYFVGIGCSSATACTAVGTINTKGGGYAPLVERWNGLSWSREKAARTRSDGYIDDQWFDSVACPSTNRCIAVGSGYHEDYLLVERWNGRRWSIQHAPAASPDGSELAAITCRSAGRCVAVGDYQDQALDDCPVPLAERLMSGGHWRIEPGPRPRECGSPQDSQLYGVSCPSWLSCTTVGSFSTFPEAYDRTLSERSKGKRWRRQRMPAIGHLVDPWGGGSYLYDVSCPSTRVCIAVGSAGSELKIAPIVERWNGSRWTVRRVGRSAMQGELFGISCRSQTSCLAVGADDSSDTALIFRFS